MHAMEQAVNSGQHVAAQHNTPVIIWFGMQIGQIVYKPGSIAKLRINGSIFDNAIRTVWYALLPVFIG